MRRVLLLAFAAVAATILLYEATGGQAPALNAAPPANARSKKIIEWGWDEPTTAWMKENIAKAEALPFDGFVLPLRLRDGADMTWKMWSTERIGYDGLAYMVDDLNSTPFKRLSDRFIRVNITPGGVQWDDDEGWNAVLDNFAVAARVANASGCKGFMFDTEQYQTAPLSAAFVNAKNDAEAREYRSLIRQRGRELISVIAHEFPDIAIIFTHSYYTYESDKQKYAYLPDLLDGMFEAALSTARLVDGWEHSYGYKRQKDYQWAFSNIKGHSAKLSSIPNLIKKKVRAGFGVWIDATYSHKSWHPDKVSENYFTPAEFESSVRNALSTSEEYVWIYSEKLNWWKHKDIPPEYAEAIRLAKSSN
jgi:hypothetical protein